MEASVNKESTKKFPFYSKYTLKENDEGNHFNSYFPLQEWWYYNVLFNDKNSDLKDWSLTISIGTFPHTDSLKLVLHDDKEKSYGNIYLKPIGTFKSEGKAVNIKLDSTYAKGQYPNWHVHSDNLKLDDHEIIVDLKFKANSLPMWIIKNTGFNNSSSPLGYYVVMNCDVSGEVFFDGKKHKVKGIGYHDHTWMPMSKNTSSKPKKKLIDFNIWDWICIHFDNGWDAFIGKIHSHQRFDLSNLIPGSICISPGGRKLVECKYFPLEYVEFKDSIIPHLKIPTKIHMKAVKINYSRKSPLTRPFNLDLTYEVENIKECIPRDPPTWIQWETTGKVYGEINESGKKTKLKGWGIMETTSNV